MAQGTLIDTGYIIALAKPSEPGHETARDYWKYLTTRYRRPIYLSSIAVSEFELIQKIPDFVLTSTIMLPFNYDDAVEAAKIDYRRERPEGVPRDSVKDDIKIIAQAKNADAEFILTRDGESLVKWCAAQREMNFLKVKTINIRDGFDVTLFGERGPDLLTPQNI